MTWRAACPRQGPTTRVSSAALSLLAGTVGLEDEETTMAGNTNLTAAREARNDEFYTQWADIEREMNA